MVVRSEDVRFSDDNNSLLESAGENDALNSKENFEERPHRQVNNGYVYFIQAGHHIKIGFSTRPLDRLRTLQISHPGKLEIVATQHASMKIEAKLHEQFSNVSKRLAVRWNGFMWDHVEEASAKAA
jgi:hypothetical protein